MKTRLSAAVAQLCLFLLTPLARAQDPKAEADSLFDQGKVMMQSNPAEAVRLLRKSMAIEPRSLTAVFIATGQKKLGKNASAWRYYNEAARLARDEQNRKQAQKDAATLETSLARVTLLVAPQTKVPGLTLLLNGEQIAEADWAKPIPVDPEPIHVEAQAKGYQPFFTKLEALEPKATVVVTIPPLQALQTSAPLPSPPPATTPTESSSAAPALSLSTSQKIGVGIAGVGLVGVVVGGVLFYKGYSDFETLKEERNRAYTERPDDYYEIRSKFDADSAAPQSQRIVGSVLVGVGGALAVGGGLLVWLAPGKETKPSAWLAIRPAVVGTNRGVWLTGSW